MEQELQKLKQTMNKANDVKDMFTGLFGNVKRDKEIKQQVDKQIAENDQDYEDEYYDEEVDGDD